MNSRKFPFSPAISLSIALLPLLLSSYLLFLADPPVWPDEGTHLYMAKTLLATGKMEAGNYGGIPEVAKVSGLGFPPLYFLTLGVWTSVFGETIEVIRALSLVIGLLCVVVFYFVVKNTSGVGLDSPGVKWIPFLATLLLSTNIYFTKAARWGRPEILALLFILLTLFFWSRGKNTPGVGLDSPGVNGILAFLFASLALATHPMGIIAPVVLFLGIIFSKTPKFSKLLQTLILSIIVSITTILWLFLTQRSLPGFIEALRLGAIAKAQDAGSAIGLLHLNSIESFLFIGQIAIITTLLLRNKLTPRRWTLTPSRWILVTTVSTLLTTIWVFIQKESYYIVYIQPFIILSLVLLVHSHLEGGLRLLRGVGFGLIAFLILSNLYLQFFSINSYSPPRKAWELGQFNYHELTKEIEAYFTSGVSSGSPEVVVFLSSIPDPYIDLSHNSRYRLLQAIDPDYPVDETKYKEALDKSDYVVYTWFPHEYLAYYVSVNAEKVGQVIGGGYTVSIAKLKERDKRH